MMLEIEVQRSPARALDVANPTAIVQNQPRKTLTSARVATLLTNARLLRSHGENALALNLLRTASNLDSKNPSVLVPLAEILGNTGRPAEAHRVRFAMMKEYYGFESVFEYAQSSYRLGRDEDALQLYYEALSLLTDESPALFDIHKNMGNIFVRQGDFESAEECYNKAYGMRPRSDVLLVNFGTLEVQRGDMDRALKHFRAAVESNPSNEKAWTGLAMIHGQMGDFELAWGGLERALDLNPGNRTSVLLASQWATRDGNPHRAIERLQAYLSSAEADVDMSLALVGLLCAARRLDLAVLETERVLAWDPTLKDVRELQDKLRAGIVA